MLRTAALLLLGLILAGCGSVEPAGGPEPAPTKHYLVYEKVVGEEGVWIANADGSNPHMLVPGGHAPAISPDGRSVAYFACNADDTCAGGGGAYIVSTSGGKPRCISCDTPLAPRNYFIIWAPDSTRLLMTRGAPSTQLEDELVTIDVADGKASVLARGWFGGASLSPDSKQVVFAKATPTTANSSEPAFDLFVNDVKGGKPRQITVGGDSEAPVWGPKSIAYSKIILGGDGWGKNELWRVQPDGSGRRTITGRLTGGLRNEGSDGLAPVAWSADGRSLLAGLTSEYGDEPVGVDPTAGSAKPVSGADGLGTAGLSHDGRYVLAYMKPVIGGIDEDNTAVVIVPYAGGKPRIVARGAWSPSWSR